MWENKRFKLSSICLWLQIPNCFLNCSASNTNLFFHRVIYSSCNECEWEAALPRKFYLHLTEETKWTHLFSLVTGMVFPPGISSWQTNCEETKKGKEWAYQRMRKADSVTRTSKTDSAETKAAYLPHHIFIIGQSQTQITDVPIITLKNQINKWSWILL